MIVLAFLACGLLWICCGTVSCLPFWAALLIQVNGHLGTQAAQTKVLDFTWRSCTARIARAKITGSTAPSVSLR